ncbi:hypothetical protein [Ideonella sp.]|uniref:hypothetical protein n=1 Tax=Ideonella sp. TaxID=1929293 RepID=UPI002B4988CB|nr:hypothetical protein [Ideonella sp.]
MLKSKIVSLLALLGAVGAAQAAIPANLVFDGYCDGMTGLAKVLPSGATGTWSNLDCAGTNAQVGGPQGKGKGETAGGYVMGSYGAGVYGSEFTWLINKDHTWTVYRSDGTYVNHGTWSAVAEGAARGTKPSVGQ